MSGIGTQSETTSPASVEEILAAIQALEIQINEDRARTEEENARIKELRAHTEEANAHIKEDRARTEEANARIKEDRARTEEANARIKELRARTEAANARTKELQARTEEANARTDKAWACAAAGAGCRDDLDSDVFTLAEQTEKELFVQRFCLMQAYPPTSWSEAPWCH